MSNTKLSYAIAIYEAERHLANERHKLLHKAEVFDQLDAYGCSSASHWLALKDERDELREALRECELFIRVLGLDSEPARKTAEHARAVLAKYPRT